MQGRVSRVHSSWMLTHQSEGWGRASWGWAQGFMQAEHVLSLLSSKTNNSQITFFQLSLQSEENSDEQVFGLFVCLFCFVPVDFVGSNICSFCNSKHFLESYLHLKEISCGVVVAHAFNPSTWEAEAGRFLSLRPAWSTKWVPGQPGLHRETLSQKNQKSNIYI